MDLYHRYANLYRTERKDAGRQLLLEREGTMWEGKNAGRIPAWMKQADTEEEVSASTPQPKVLTPVLRLLGMAK